jgi:hydroxypyruvate reductase
VRETSHPVPDERSQAAAEDVLARAGRLGADDLVLLLVSGGGSALVCAPWGISLEEKRAVNRGLLRSGPRSGR